jgi:MFS family permease
MTNGRDRHLLAALCVAQFVDVLSVTAVVVALPDIRIDLGLSLATAQAVISAYALLFGSLLMAFGRLADVVGRRRLVLTGLLVFAASAALAAAAPNGLVLVPARAVQGAAAACTVPAALAALTDRFDGAARRAALAAWTAAGAGGGAAGFAVGGVVSGALGWRATFVVLAALACAGAASVAATMIVEAPPAGDPRLDVAGAALGTGALVLGLFGLTGVQEDGDVAFAVATLAGAAALLVAFVAVERRARSPLVPGRAATNRALLLGVLASAALTATTSPAAVLGTTFLQTVRDWSASATGLAFVPFSLAVIAGSGAGQRILGRFGPRAGLAAGLGGIAAALALSATITAAGGEARLIAGLVLSGFSLGCGAVSATAVGTAAVPAADRGLASGLVNTGTQLGTALGVAVFVPLAGTHVSGLRHGYLGAAALAAAAATAPRNARACGA